MAVRSGGKDDVEAVDLELEDALGPLEVLQLVLAGSTMDVLRKLVLDELARRVRQQHLSAVPRGADPCSAVDAHADVPLAADERLARVDPDPHAKRGAVRPGLGGERPLCGHGGRDRVARACEGDEERVTLRVDLVPVELLDRRAKQLGVPRQHRVVSLRGAVPAAASTPLCR